MTTVTAKFTMTMNPVDAGSNVQLSTDDPVWAGTASENLDAENVTVSGAPLGTAFGPGSQQLLAQNTLPFAVLGGLWQTGAAPINTAIGGGDGTYQVTAEIGPRSNPLITVSEDVIVANTNTPFSAIGMAFIDLNTGLSQTAAPKAAVLQDLTAEERGLTVLHSDDGFPDKPFHTLIKDIDAEIRTLDFSTKLPTASADPSVVASLVKAQTAIAAYVHDTPALVALLNPAGTGW